MESSATESSSVYQKLLDLTGRFEGIRIAVIGDVMLDRYWWCTVSRISPEAPVPVVRHERSTLAAGGAAYVAANIAGLGGEPLLVGLIGRDEGGRELPEVLEGANVSTKFLIELAERPTTVKTRIVAHSQHVVRLDNEDAAPISDDQAREFARHVKSVLASAEVVVVSDYAKGLLTPLLLEEIIAEASRLGLPVLVDPKGVDYRRYAGATLITPNRTEAARASGVDESSPESIEESGRILLEQLDVASCLITLGEDGMMLFRREQSPEHLSAMAREVYDVTGAGDTVIATLALMLAAGLPLRQAVPIANRAGSIVVGKFGTASVSYQELFPS